MAFALKLKVGKSWKVLKEGRKTLSFNTVSAAEKHMLDNFRGLPQAYYSVVTTASLEAEAAQKEAARAKPQ